MSRFEGPCTVKGGLPLWAVCWASGPDFQGEYDAGVSSLHWRKKDGTKGKEVTQAFYDSLEDYWEADVTEQVSEALAYEEYQKKYGDDQNIPLDCSN